MIPGLLTQPAQWVKDLVLPMNYGVDGNHGSDPALPWLWYRLAAAAPIRPLAWEPPYATGAALKRQKTKQTNKNEITSLD